jgi:hypothetical protein
MRTVKKRVMAIALAGRQPGVEREERQRRQYAELITVTRRTLHQAKGVLEEVEQLPRCRRQCLRPLTEKLETMAGQVGHVIRQTRARIFEGVTHFPWKLVSLFEPQTEIIRKGKASRPTEFGKLVQVQEAENQIITDFIGCSPNAPAIRNCWSLRSSSTSGASGACRDWWLPTLASIRGGTRRGFRRWGCLGSRFRIGAHAAENGERCKDGGGSAPPRNGGREAKAASAC